MERVDHVHVIEVGCCSLVCYVYRMLERKVPYRECLELGVSRLDVPLVLMVELAQTYSHLSASRTRSSHDYERLCRLDIVILSESLVRIDEGNVVWISLDCIMVIHLDSEALEAGPVSICACLTVVMGHHDAAYIKADILKLATESE